MQGILGTVAAALVADVVGALVTGDVPAGLRAINGAFDGGAEPRQFAGDILEHLRALMLLSVGGADGLESLGTETIEDLRALTALPGYSLARVVRAIRLFSEATQALRYAVRPELPLELALVEATLPATAAAEAGADESDAPGAAPAPQAPARAASPAPRTTAPIQQTPSPAPRTPRPAPQAMDSTPQAPSPAPQTASPAPEPAPEPAPTREAAAVHEEPPGGDAAEEQADAPPARALTLDWVRGHWQKVLMHVRSNSRNVEALLKSAEPVDVRDNTVLLGCEAEFHCTTLSEEKRRVVVEQALSAVLGVPCTISCHVMANLRGAQPSPPAGAPEDLFQAGEPRRSAEERLLNHPAVKEMQRQGGRITRVRVHDVEDTEEERGE